MKRILVWFRHDLRLKDNVVLSAALQDADEIIPFYCFDDHYYRDLPFGFPKTGAFRAQFIRESVENLRLNLKSKGADLVIRQGATFDEIQAIHQQLPLDAIYLAQEVTREEWEIEKRVEGLSIPMQKFWNYSLYHLDDLPFDIDQSPSVFTPLRKKLEKYSKVREPLTAPKNIKSSKEIAPGGLPSLSEMGLEEPRPDSRGVLEFKGGEDAAWQRLEDYFWKEDRLKDYKFTRNGLVGEDYSSKLSPWLSQGCISPRSIYSEIERYESERIKNVSTYWLFFELVWRDFFRITALKEGDYFFRMSRDWKPNTNQKFEDWRQGSTGQDFVDANMRELLSTGFMSNRGRQNVASYLINDLNQPWYAGAAWFESQLIDHDVCSNYGNWTYIAGAGHDPRKGRFFNVESQAQRYDEDGAYRQLWSRKK